jgi:hypothetical protein
LDGYTGDVSTDPIKPSKRPRGRKPKDPNLIKKNEIKNINAVTVAKLEEPPTWVNKLLQGLATPSAKVDNLAGEKSGASSKKKKKSDVFERVSKNMEKTFKLQLMGLDYHSKLQTQKQSAQNGFEITAAAHKSQMRAFERNELLLDTQARAQANFMYTYQAPQSTVETLAFSRESKKIKKRKTKASGESTSLSKTNSKVNLAISSSSSLVDTQEKRKKKKNLAESESEVPSSESENEDTDDSTCGSSDETEDDNEEEDSSSDGDEDSDD